jgi:hypothetical protein
VQWNGMSRCESESETGIGSKDVIGKGSESGRVGSLEVLVGVGQRDILMSPSHVRELKEPPHWTWT